MKKIINTAENSTLHSPLWEYEVERFMAQDKDEQNEACREYLAYTSPAKWSYEGWLDYWRLHCPVVGMPDEIMYVDEARFNELRRAEAFAQADIVGLAQLWADSGAVNIMSFRQFLETKL